jgi:hypothetical protein
VLLDGEDPDEIERLFSFLRAHLEGRFAGATGDVRIIKAEEYEKLARLVDLVPNLASPDMVELIKLILPRVDDAASYLPDFVEAFEASEPRVVEHIAVAARLVRYRLAHERLAALVEDPATTEHEYQQLLSENPWIFGSEYSELLDRRTWARDDSLDFMLRRTTDDYLEIVEIKTAFTEPLFVHDRSHDSYHPSAKLSAVLGQVMHYVSEIERSRDAILCKDGCDTLKIRARVVAGRDGGPKHQSALRTLNAHLHGIEVLTFDQLLRIARKVLDVFEGVVKADEHESGEQDRPVRPF